MKLYPQVWHTYVFLAMLAAIILWQILSAFAHDHDRPELDQWYRSLTNIQGGYCCEGSEALSVENPDWDTTGATEDFPYRVFLNGQWIKVYKLAVVKGTNRAGIAKVWPVFVNGQPPTVRCFLPGTLS